MGSPGDGSGECRPHQREVRAWRLGGRLPLPVSIAGAYRAPGAPAAAQAVGLVGSRTATHQFRFRRQLLRQDGTLKALKSSIRGREHMKLRPLVFSAVALFGLWSGNASAAQEILNASYDVARELFQSIKIGRASCRE